MPDLKPCPYCAEDIRAAAIRCPHCRSRLTSFDAGRWHRSHPEARLAGVCAALARVFAIPVAAVRLGFIVLSFFHLVGPIVYSALWLVIPPRPGEDSLLESALERLLNWVRALNRPADESRPAASREITTRADG